MCLVLVPHKDDSCATYVCHRLVIVFSWHLAFWTSCHSLRCTAQSWWDWTCSHHCCPLRQFTTRLLKLHLALGQMTQACEYIHKPMVAPDQANFCARCHRTERKSATKYSCGCSEAVLVLDVTEHQQRQQTCTQWVQTTPMCLACKCKADWQRAEPRAASTRLQLPKQSLQISNLSQTGPVPTTANACHVVCQPCAVDGTGLVWNRLLLVMAQALFGIDWYRSLLQLFNRLWVTRCKQPEFSCKGTT